MLPVLVLFFVASFFAAFLILVSYLAAPKDKATAAKKDAYECGIVSDKPSSSRVPVKFYLTGLLFIIFDIEIIFSLPLCSGLQGFCGKRSGSSGSCRCGLLFDFVCVWIVVGDPHKSLGMEIKWVEIFLR